MEPRPAHRAGADPACADCPFSLGVSRLEAMEAVCGRPVRCSSRPFRPVGKAGRQIAGGQRKDRCRNPVPAAGDGQAVRPREPRPRSRNGAGDGRALRAISWPMRSSTTRNGPPASSSNSRNCSTGNTTICGPHCVGPVRTIPKPRSGSPPASGGSGSSADTRSRERAGSSVRLPLRPEPTRPRAAALIGLTGLDSRQGRSDRHRAFGAEALAIVRQIGDPDEIVMARITEATLAWSTYDLDEAEEMATQVRTEALRGGRPEHAAASSWLLGQCALFREDGQLAVGTVRYLSGGAGRVPTPVPGRSCRVISPSQQLVPIVGRQVPYLEETMLLGQAGRRHPGHRLCAGGTRLREPAHRGRSGGDRGRLRCRRALCRAG